MNIFISYSSKSRAVVDALAMDLEALGHTVWYDQRLTGGHDWWSEILVSIRRCHLFLFALTPEALDSRPCQIEFEYAESLDKRILPVLLGDININVLPSSLQKLQIIDYRNFDKQQAIVLSRALGCLPKTRPLPRLLPPTPEVPLAPITQIRDQIDSYCLTVDEQRTLVLELRDLLINPDTREDALTLLERMHRRSDLTKKIRGEIAIMLNLPDKRTTAERRVSPDIQVFRGHTDAIFSVAYSPNGETILTGSTDNTARLWDARTGEELQQFIGHEGAVFSVAFAPNGETVLTGSRDQTMRLWDIVTGQEIQRFVGHTDAIWSAVYSPNGHNVLSGSFDTTVRLWDIVTGREIRRFEGHGAAVWGVAYAPDGATILTSSWDKTVRLWNVRTGAERYHFLGNSSHVVNVKFSPDGCTALTSSRDGISRLWHVQTGCELQQFPGHTAFSIAFSPDGRTIALGGEDNIVNLWDISTMTTIGQLDGHGKPITKIAFSPDGTALLTGSIDKTARLWDLTAILSGAHHSTQHTYAVR